MMKLFRLINTNPSSGTLELQILIVRLSTWGLGADPKFRMMVTWVYSGAGENYRLIAATWLVMDIYYYKGLTNLYQNNIGNGKNRNIGVGLGVVFGVGKAKK